MPAPKRGKPVGAPLWVLSYGDLMGLLLVFFIFICSVRGVRLERGKERLAPGRNIAHAAGRPGSERSHPFLDGEAPRPAAGQGAPVALSVYFEHQESQVPEAARAELERLAPVLWSSGVPWVLCGFVSPLLEPGEAGSEAEAHGLAFARALAVLEVLARRAPRVAHERPEAAPFYPASGGYHGDVVASPLGARGDGRDRVDIYPFAKEEQ